MKQSADVWCGRIRLVALAEAYYTKGVTMTQLARVARVSADAISVALKRNEYRTKWTGKRRAVTELDIRRAIAAGMSQSELAKKKKVHQSSVSRAAARHGIRWCEEVDNLAREKERRAA